MMIHADVDDLGKGGHELSPTTGKKLTGRARFLFSQLILQEMLVPDWHVARLNYVNHEIPPHLIIQINFHVDVFQQVLVRDVAVEMAT
jgi:hypothetical protein